MTFGSVFGRTFSPTFQPSSQAAADTSWWLAGRISASDCIAAYQPRGRRGYAASLINITANSKPYRHRNRPVMGCNKRVDCR